VINEKTSEQQSETKKKFATDPLFGRSEEREWDSAGVSFQPEHIGLSDFGEETISSPPIEGLVKASVSLITGGLSALLSEDPPGARKGLKNHTSPTMPNPQQNNLPN
jgi:hypothetical protein